MRISTKNIIYNDDDEMIATIVNDTETGTVLTIHETLDYFEIDRIAEQIMTFLETEDVIDLTRIVGAIFLCQNTSKAYSFDDLDFIVINEIF